MYGSMWFLQKFARRAMRTSMRDTSFHLGRGRARTGTRKTAASSGHVRATRFPAIKRGRRRGEICFSQDVIGPVVLVFIAGIVAVAVIGVSDTYVGSVLMMVVAVFAALLAGGAVANALFRNRGHRRGGACGEHEKEVTKC